MVVDGVDVEAGVVEVRGGRRDEFGAGDAEEFLEEGEGVGPAALQARELVAVLVAQSRVDGVVELGGMESDADRHKGMHLVVLLADAVVLRRVLLEVLGARHVDEDVREHADGVGVAAQHHVAEADVVVGREVRRHHPREHGFFVELDVIECLERKAKVTQKAVHAQQADDAEVPQHAVERAGAVVARHRHWVFIALHSFQLLVDL